MADATAERGQSMGGRRTEPGVRSGETLVAASAGDVTPHDTILVPGLRRPARIAAMADLHARRDQPLALGSSFRRVAEAADLLLVAGDLTDNGRLEEFELVADELATLSIPVFAVLGNHDRRCLRRTAMRRTLEAAGIVLLDGSGAMVELDGPIGEPPVRIEVVGIGGYGGGFWPDEPGERPPLHRATQAFAVRARREAVRLDATLTIAAPDVDVRIVLMHYSPTSSTLGQEPIVKYWMLGNVELARVVDRHRVDLVVHGHAHLGNETGQTVGGTPVRNVASQVVGGPIIYELHGDGERPAPDLPGTDLSDLAGFHDVIAETDGSPA